MTEPPGATLFKGDVGGTNVSLWVEYVPDTGVTISGSDFGAAPKGVFGSSEYEYWRSVGLEDVERLFEALLRDIGAEPEPFDVDRLINLIVERFGGTYEAEKNFREWCEEHDIPTTFHSWALGF